METELFALLTLKDAEAAKVQLPEATFTEMAMACEPDNMLVNEFEQREGHVPVVERLYRIVYRGDDASTEKVRAALPSGAYWYGSTQADYNGANDRTPDCN